jgi:hypothetical protein
MQYRNNAPKEYKPYPDNGTLKATGSKLKPTSPDYWGDIAINLKDLTNIEVKDGLHIIKLSGWKKLDSSGKTYLSLSVKRSVPQDKPASRPQGNSGFDDMSSEF